MCIRDRSESGKWHLHYFIRYLSCLRHLRHLKYCVFHSSTSDSDWMISQCHPWRDTKVDIGGFSRNANWVVIDAIGQDTEIIDRRLRGLARRVLQWITATSRCLILICPPRGGVLLSVAYQFYVVLIWTQCSVVSRDHIFPIHFPVFNSISILPRHFTTDATKTANLAID